MSRGPDRPVAVVLIASLMTGLAASAAPKHPSTMADPGAGRDFALRACTGCHIVSPDQPFAPLIDRAPPPPDFVAIANKPNTTPQSLRRFFASLCARVGILFGTPDEETEPVSTPPPAPAPARWVRRAKRAGLEPEQFVPLVNIAAGEWLARAAEHAREELEALCRQCEQEDIPAIHRRPGPAILCRRHHRGFADGPLANQAQFRDLAQYCLYL